MKDMNLRIRVTENQKQIISDKAKEDGKNVSEYIMSLIIKDLALKDQDLILKFLNV